MAGWIKKQDSTLCCLQKTHFNSKDTQPQSEEMEEDSPCKWKPKESGDDHT